MTDDEIKERIEQLDANIPKDGAKVFIEFEGGPCEVTANCAGYLRLGVEMLRAAVAPLETGQMFTPITIDHLTVDRSLKVRRFSRREDVEACVPTPRVRSESWKNKAAAVGCVTIAVFLGVCTLVGLIEVMGWIWR